MSKKLYDAFNTSGDLPRESAKLGAVSVPRRVGLERARIGGRRVQKVDAYVEPGAPMMEAEKLEVIPVRGGRFAMVYKSYGEFGSVAAKHPMGDHFVTSGLFCAQDLGGRMIKVLASKVFPSKATLTKFEYVKDENRIVFYVRENVRTFTPGGPIQILEVCAPADKFTEVVAIVELEDSLKRNAYQAEDFTEAWAEGHLFVPTISGMPKERTS